MNKTFLLVGVSFFGATFVDGQSNGVISNGLVGYYEYDLSIGLMREKFIGNSILSSYEMPLNQTIDKMIFNKVYFGGADVRFGYYLNSKKNIALSVGVGVSNSNGQANLNAFHIEYLSYDEGNNAFRQLLSCKSISEYVTTIGLDLPVLVNYSKQVIIKRGKKDSLERSKQKTDKKVGNIKLVCEIAAGVVYNLMYRSYFDASSVFNYEAIYKYVDGVAVYENAPVPDVHDVLYTAKQIRPANNNTVVSQFDELRSEGYNVGLNQELKKKGIVNYQGNGIGYVLHPSIGYELSEGKYIKIGVSICFQNLSNIGITDKRITDKVGEYSSLLNQSKEINTFKIGVNAGIRVCLKNNENVRRKIVIH